MLKQRSQKTTSSRTAISAAARVRASASGARRRWYVSRWAVLGPMPGRRANASIRRATGSMTGLATGRRSQARDARGRRSRRPSSARPSSREARRASLTAATTRSWSMSTSSGSTADGSMVMPDQLLLAGHGRADDAAARRAVDGRRLQLLLDARHLLLHLLRHPLQVRHAHDRVPPRSWFVRTSLRDCRATRSRRTAWVARARRAAAGQLTSATSSKVVVEDALRLGQDEVARRLRRSAGSRSRLVATQRTPTSWPRTCSMPASRIAPRASRRPRGGTPAPPGSRASRRHPRR